MNWVTVEKNRKEGEFNIELTFFSYLVLFFNIISFYYCK